MIQSGAMLLLSTYITKRKTPGPSVDIYLLGEGGGGEGGGGGGGSGGGGGPSRRNVCFSPIPNKN